MNREIKFRVFNGVEMTDCVIVGKFGAFFVNPSNNGIDEKDSASLSPFNTKYHENTPVMQFTGLTDKNGKEIYEGDILIKKEEDWSITDNWAKDDDRWQVSDLKLPLKEVNRDVATMGRFPNYWLENEHFGYEGEDLQEPEEYEIIGNIYENPELKTGF